MEQFYCLTVEKIQGKSSKVVRRKNEEKCFHRNVECVLVNNLDLLKSKKTMDY